MSSHLQDTDALIQQQPTTMHNYDHLLHFDEPSRELRIYRVDSTGQKTLFTSTRVPASSGWSEAVEKLAHDLGEQLLMDSPSARKLLQL